MEQLGWTIDRRLDELVDARLHLAMLDAEGASISSWLRRLAMGSRFLVVRREFTSVDQSICVDSNLSRCSDRW